ncbi:matrilysin [Calliopsis andreniformis]|uniref:matrilysin n=1 Tax=Calliopsis andreniformis TaxID=337506 RepID=UPI003FCC7148
MDLSYSILFCIVFILGKYESVPIYSKINDTSASLTAMDFMKKYGYLQSGTADSDALYKESTITEAIKALQKFGNIPITGQLDNMTLELMSAPRCGVVDILRKNEEQQQEKRHVIELKSRRKRDITTNG